MKSKSANGLFIVFWIGLFAVLVYGFNRWHASQRGGIAEAVVTNTEKKLVLLAGKEHHFRFKGRINKEAVYFLVDTGASKVSVPGHIAKKAGLTKQYPIVVSTANGAANAFLTRIHTLKLGPITLHDVSAVIMSQSNGEVLLGMSALKKLEMKQEDGKLVLIQKREQ